MCALHILLADDVVDFSTILWKLPRSFIVFRRKCGEHAAYMPKDQTLKKTRVTRTLLSPGYHMARGMGADVF